MVKVDMVRLLNNTVHAIQLLPPITGVLRHQAPRHNHESRLA